MVSSYNSASCRRSGNVRYACASAIISAAKATGHGTREPNESNRIATRERMRRPSEEPSKAVGGNVEKCWKADQMQRGKRKVFMRKKVKTFPNGS